jgi:hypothetical protein
LRAFTVDALETFKKKVLDFKVFAGDNELELSDFSCVLKEVEAGFMIDYICIDQSSLHDLLISVSVSNVDSFSSVYERKHEMYGSVSGFLSRRNFNLHPGEVQVVGKSDSVSMTSDVRDGPTVCWLQL